MVADDVSADVVSAALFNDVFVTRRGEVVSDGCNHVGNADAWSEGSIA
jgi:hypothetical protein